MIGDALLLTFDGADATAGALHTSTNIPLPAYDFGVQGAEHLDVMFQAHSVLTAATRVELIFQTSAVANFATVDVVGSILSTNAKYRTSPFEPLFLRLSRRMLEFNRLMVNFAVQPTAGTFTAGLVSGVNTRRNFPKGYSH